MSPFGSVFASLLSRQTPEERRAVQISRTEVAQRLAYRERG